MMAPTAPLTGNQTDEDAALPVRSNSRPSGQRLNLILSETAYEELCALARERRTAMKEIVRLGIGLAKIAIRESSRGNKLIITTSNGEPLRELVLPD